MKKVGIFCIALCLICVSCGNGNSNSSSKSDIWESVPSPYWEADANDFSRDYYGNIVFKGENSDGYIPNGQITLYTIGGISKTFKCYKKSNSVYVKYGYLYYQISGPGSSSTVTIDNLKYKTR